MENIVVVDDPQNPPWPEGCVEAIGCRTEKGYVIGNIAVAAYKSYNVRAHRIAYESAYGPADGFIVMHTCDNPPCVNPRHLRLGTPKDNTQDMLAKGRGFQEKPYTHCRKGHELTPDNTIIKSDGRQTCRTCRKAWHQAHPVKEAQGNG